MPNYNKNFLDKVVLGIIFDDVGLTPLEEYKATISEIFDISKQIQGFTGSVNINVAEGTVQQDRRPLAVWQFLSSSKPKKTLALAQNQLVIEYNDRSYTDSSELLNDVTKIFLTFIDKFDVKIVNRVGLRYINQIQFDEKPSGVDWSRYVDPNLAASFEFIKQKDLVSARSFCQQFLKFSDVDLNFYYGVWNNDFPNAISKEIFSLDYDCFSAVPTSTQELNLIERIKSYNKYIEGLFEKSISEELREHMRGVQK